MNMSKFIVKYFSISKKINTNKTMACLSTYGLKSSSLLGGVSIGIE